MGRATITGGGPDGLYEISLDYGSDRIEAQIAALLELIADLNAQLAAKTLELAEAQDPAAREALAEARTSGRPRPSE